MKKHIKYISSLFLLILAGCDGGIAPLPDEGKAVFSGTITFVGDWAVSVTRTHLVAFKNELVEPSDFFPPNLSYASDEIVPGSTVFEYRSDEFAFIDINPGIYNYIAVVQSTTASFSLNRGDWFVVGVYYAGGDTTKPGTMTLNAGRTVSGINIICDFNNPPPQPPGGN